MESRPLVSICIFNYNYGRFLGDAVRAALAQTYAHIEVVVCDNASTDNSMEVLAQFSHDRRLRVYRNTENIGWLRNQQRALELATGSYAVAIPADDILLPSFCAHAMTFLEDNQATTDAVYASVAYADVTLTPHISGHCQGLLPGYYTGGRNEFRELLRMDHIRWPVMLTRRDTFLRFADLGAHLHAQADWEVLLAMSAAGIRFGYLPETQALIRRHGAQCTSDSTFVNTVRELEDYLSIHERYATKQYHALFHGIEQTLLADFERLYARIKHSDIRAAASEIEIRAQTYREQLQALSTAPLPKHPAGTPRISIIVTTSGKRPAALRRALSSLEEQHEQNFEIIIVQTGGESLAPWITTLPLAARTRFFHALSPLTEAAARNIGIRLSAGEFITYLDDDSAFAPNHLSFARHVLDETGSAAVCANTSVAIDGMRIQNLLGLGADKTSLEIAPMVPAPAYMHRYSCIEQVGYFAENLPVLDDWHFLLNLALHAPITASGAETVEIDIPGTFFGTTYARAGAESFFAIIDMIYAAVPLRSMADGAARTLYRKRLLAAWPAPGSGGEALRGFMLALAGVPMPTAPELAHGGSRI